MRSWISSNPALQEASCAALSSYSLPCCSMTGLLSTCWSWRHITPLTATVKLVHRSSKAIDETAPKRPVWWRRTPPDPGAGVAVELGGGDVGHIREILGVG